MPLSWRLIYSQYTLETEADFWLNWRWNVVIRKVNWISRWIHFACDIKQLRPLKFSMLRNGPKFAAKRRNHRSSLASAKWTGDITIVSFSERKNRVHWRDNKPPTVKLYSISSFYYQPVNSYGRRAMARTSRRTSQKSLVTFLLIQAIIQLVRCLKGLLLPPDLFIFVNSSFW